MKVAVIGGGAGGFFSAIHVKENHPEATVTIFEKSKKVLSKVKISGGGRCNVTNGCTSISELSKAYPRGNRQLKKAFRKFSTKDTMQWFEKRNVPLVIQEDNCVFPVSQDSQSIIDCFLKEVQRLNIKIETGKGVKSIKPKNEKYILEFLKSEHPDLIFDKIIIATGGHPKKSGFEWLEKTGHRIEDPVPSLYTFNMPRENITELMGIVVENAMAQIQGTKLIADGPLLITHWGMSGPAILKLSAFGARILNDMNYEFNVRVNWINILNNETVKKELSDIIQQHGKKILSNYRPYSLPDRLWQYLLHKSGLPSTKKWNELGRKGVHKIIDTLTHDIYNVKGKTTFKEEFVTCGGVALEQIDFDTMQSKVCKNIYFTGEVLDIDGITGGYNFQAAWTTAFIAGRLAD